MDSADNHSTISCDFEHVEETVVDDGAKQQEQQQQQKQSHDSMDDSNWSSDNCNAVEILRSEFQAEIVAMKTANNVMLAKIDALQAQNGELRANNRELQAKLENVELKAKLASIELRKMVEAKMIEMACKSGLKNKALKQETERKLAGLEAKILEKDMKLDQLLEKMDRQFVDDNSVELRGEISVLGDKIGEMQHKFSEELELVKKETGEVMNDKLQKQIHDMLQEHEEKMADKDRAMKAECENMVKQQPWKNQLIQKYHQCFNFVTPNAWDKRNEDVTVDGLLVTKSGTTQKYGHALAKFAYATFYFEVLVKEKHGLIDIGVSDKDCTTNGNSWVGEISGSCCITSAAHCYDSGTLLRAFFPAGFDTNDTVGCGVIFLPENDQHVFFATKNGTIHGKFIVLPSNVAKLLFASVSLAGEGTAVEANFGNDLTKKPFKFNPAEHKF